MENVVVNYHVDGVPEEFQDYAARHYDNWMIVITDIIQGALPRFNHEFEETYGIKRKYDDYEFYKRWMAKKYCDLIYEPYSLGDRFWADDDLHIHMEWDEFPESDIWSDSWIG